MERNAVYRLVRLASLALFASLSTQGSAYEVQTRWTTTATDGTVGSTSAVGVPVTVTWSFAPDGTAIPAETSGTVPSNLINFLDSGWGAGSGGGDYASRPWFPIFQQSFDRISALSGVTYVYEPNDTGSSFSNAFNRRGILGVRGDVRLGGKSYGAGSTTLASNYYPNYGEMMINTDQAAFFLNNTNGSRRFRNTIMHESLHGLGLAHVEASIAGFLLEPILSTSFDGPQLDDVLGLQRLYGDFYEKSGGNDVVARATPLGLVSALQPQIIGTQGGSTFIGAAQTDFVSIDDVSDNDFFSFTLQETLDVTLKLSPQGTSYQVGPQGGTQTTFDSRTLSDLSLALFAPDGSAVLDFANAAGLGAEESIVRRLDAGTYYARVAGAQSDVQLYQFAVTASPPPPRSLLWAGLTSSEWDVLLTANFTADGAPVTFRAADEVRFDDASSVRTVTLTADVAPGGVVVDSVGEYHFVGAGGLIAGTLLVTGGGTLELANAGNSYGGDTLVAAGVLKITGDANAMVTPITITSGASLVMNAADARDMASLIGVEAGAVMQVGELGTQSQVLPDSPAGIALDGLMRILDAETIRHVSGKGVMRVEREEARFRDNAFFGGEVVVESGAVAQVVNADGLGSVEGRTVVEEGGSAAIVADMTLAEPFSLSGDGNGEGAIRVGENCTVEFQGDLSLNGPLVLLAIEGGATVHLLGAVEDALVDSRLTLDVAAGAELTFDGELSVGQQVQKTGGGAAIVAGTAAVSGDVDVNAGELSLLGSGALTGSLHVAAGAALTVQGVQWLTETTRLTGAGEVRGDLAVPGVLAPGDGLGVLAFTDNLALTSASRLQIEVSRLGTEVVADRVDVTGAVSLSGALELAFVDDFSPALGESFSILSASAITGAFTDLLLPQLPNDFAWHIAYSASSVTLSVGAPVQFDPADFNSDGSVDGGDLAIWTSAYGVSGAAPLLGDGDGNETVDGADFLIWQRAASATPPAAAIVVPEPTSRLLSVAATVMFVRSRRRRRLAARSGSELEAS